MIRLTLQREASTEVETMGRLSWFEDGGVVQVHTVEQEWRPTAPGGEPFNSCVPAGRYDLIPHIHHGKDVVALVNPGLGVYYEELDRPSGVGRYMILIHPGNTHTDVVGCISPGLGRSGQMVTNSRKAMKQLMDVIGGQAAEIIIHDSEG